MRKAGMGVCYVVCHYEVWTKKSTTLQPTPVFMSQKSKGNDSLYKTGLGEAAIIIRMQLRLQEYEEQKPPCHNSEY